MEHEHTSTVYTYVVHLFAGRSLFTPGCISTASTAGPVWPVRDPHSAWRQTEEYLSWAENLLIHHGFIHCMYQPFLVLVQ